jgi:hypothetical protein
VLAAAGSVLFLIAQIEKRRELWIRNCDDIAAIAAIAAVRPAAGDKLLAAKAHTPAPAVTAEDSDLGFIDKLHARNRGMLADGLPNRANSAFAQAAYHIIASLKAKKKPRKGLFPSRLVVLLDG